MVVGYCPLQSLTEIVLIPGQQINVSGTVRVYFADFIWTPELQRSPGEESLGCVCSHWELRVNSEGPNQVPLSYHTQQKHTQVPELTVLMKDHSQNNWYATKELSVLGKCFSTLQWSPHNKASVSIEYQGNWFQAASRPITHSECVESKWIIYSKKSCLWDRPIQAVRLTSRYDDVT